MIKQFLSPGFERENFFECQQCLEPITNPICHSCINQGILTWMSAYPNIKKKLAPKLKKYTKEVDSLVANSVNCVSCSKKAALCPYCFTEGVFNLFKKNKVDSQIIGDFLSIFNFDLHHEGYIEEAKKEGLY